MNVRGIGLFFIAILLLGGGLLTRSIHSKNFQNELLENIGQHVANEFLAIDNEAQRILKEGLDNSSSSWDQASHFFAHVDSSRIIAWNRTDYLPDVTTLLSLDNASLFQSQRGDFLIRRWNASDGTFLFAFLTLTDRYPIINNFLSARWNPDIFPIRDVQLVPANDSRGYLIQYNGQPLFRVVPGKPEMHESTASFLLLTAGWVVFMMMLFVLIGTLNRTRGPDLALLVLFLGLLSFRIGMLMINYPALFFASDVFDPKRFASSSLNASLGDLFFNALSLLSLVIFFTIHFRKFKFVLWLMKTDGAVRFCAGIFCLLICFIALLFPYDFIEAIYHNSTLSLDVMQSLSFDTARIVAIAAVWAGCISSFLVIHIFFSLATHLLDHHSKWFFPGLLASAIVFVIAFYGRNVSATLLTGIVFFTILKVTGLNRGAFQVSFQLFIYLIFSLGIFSLQNAWAVRWFYKERQVTDQVRFGKDFLTERDVLGEYLLDQARQRIEKDQFIQTRMGSPFLSKSPVLDKIQRVHLSNYFDRYEISMKTRPVDVKDPADSAGFHGLSNFSLTGYPGILYARASEGNTVKRYHVSIPIYYQRPVGFVELDLSLKRVIPENVYPELLVDNRFNQIYRNRDFSYAVFAKAKLASSFGPFNYEKDFPLSRLEKSELYHTGLSDGKYFHIAIEDVDGSIAVVSAANYPWLYFVTNFSFWFVLGLTLLFIVQGLFGINSYWSGNHVNYTTRIQLFIFLAFLLPVLAVSITTLTLIGKSNEEGIKNDFVQRSITVSQRIAGLISSDSSSVSGEAALEDWIEENAASSKIDISVYSGDGQLIATSQPALFVDQLISPLINREAMKKIVLGHEGQTVTTEQIGNLKYSCAYSAVLSPETGQLVAIVGLPFFESASFLQKSQSLIVSNILIIFVIVFIFFSILSFWAARSLTSPLKMLTKTLAQTTLTGQNKPLHWKSSDEMGTLVQEYNRMVEHLEESKQALAKNEKESAWREMARQVAHEIKNPLTPMKLTLQQMDLALRTGNLPVEKSQKSVDVLLKQVEILNEIAISFSTFASMPPLSPREVDLQAILQETVNLFVTSNLGRVHFEPLKDATMVRLDPASFSRAISNIIINALQAAKDGQNTVEVNLSISCTPDLLTISIRDNGRGMTPDVQEKIFQPQFTTKQSGSGLGLALTRQIILHSGGTIRFDSVPGQGTVFHIEVPRA